MPIIFLCNIFMVSKGNTVINGRPQSVIYVSGLLILTAVVEPLTHW